MVPEHSKVEGEFILHSYHISLLSLVCVSSLLDSELHEGKELWLHWWSLSPEHLLTGSHLDFTHLRNVYYQDIFDFKIKEKGKIAQGKQKSIIA